MRALGLANSPCLWHRKNGKTMRPQSRQSETGLWLVCNVRSKCTQSQTHKSNVATTKHMCKVWNECTSINVDLASLRPDCSLPHVRSHTPSSLSFLVKDRQRMWLKTHRKTQERLPLWGFTFLGFRLKTTVAHLKPFPIWRGKKTEKWAGLQALRVYLSLQYYSTFQSK